jgi:hypothetical protein
MRQVKIVQSSRGFPPYGRFLTSIREELPLSKYTDKIKCDEWENTFQRLVGIFFEMVLVWR